MIKFRATAALLLACIVLSPLAALAQTSPGLTYGQVPTAAQWNSYFAAKQDVLGYTPVNKAGDIMVGRLVTAPPSSTTAGLNLTPGTTPASPVNGDLWATSTALFARINGSTINLSTPGLLPQNANTVLANVTAGSAVPTGFAMPSCVGSANALQYVTNTGFTCSAIVAAAGSVAIGTTTITGGTTTRILYDNGAVLGEYTISGSGTAVAMNTSPAITGGSHVAITSFGLRSSGSGAFDLTIANTENLTAGRTLTITTNDAARTLSMGGNILTAGAFTTAGAFGLTLTATATTNVTLPAGSSSMARIDAGQTFAGTQNYTGAITLNPASADAITINTAAASTAKMFNGTQSGPATSPSGPLPFNLLTISNAASVTTPFTLTNGMLNAEVRGFHIEFNDTGASSVTAAFSAHTVVNSGSPGGDKIAILGNTYSNKSISGYLLGGDMVSSVDTGGSTPFLVGVQVEAIVYGTGTATNRIGVNATSSGVGQGSTLDAAFALDNVGVAGSAWKKGISFGTSNAVAAAIDPAGDAMFAAGTQTVANFANMANMTVTGNIFNFPNFSIVNTNNQNAPTQMSLANNNAGNSALVQFNVSNGTNTLTSGIAGTGLTGAYQGKAFVTGNGAALIVGTTTTQPTQLFANNAEVARITTAGFGIGTTNPQTKLSISANAAATPSAAPSGAFISGANLWMVGVDGTTNNTILMDQYGGQGTNNNSLAMRSGRGTAASPTATASGDTLGGFQFLGYTGSAFYRSAGLFVVANETYSGTVGGGDLQWYLTPNGTQALSQSVTFRASGALVVGAVATDPGVGAFYANTSITAGASIKLGTGAGKLAWSATAPTVSTGFCTSPSISNNNGTAAFTITIGSTCAASTGVLTLPSASVGWACNFRNVTNPATNAPAQISSTTNSVSVTNYVRTTGIAGNWTAADVIVADCAAY